MKNDRRKWSVFVCFSVLFIFALFFRTSIATIAEDLMHEFATPATFLGLMSSTFFYAYAAMQAPAGLLSDRIGVDRTVLCFGVLGGAGALLFASASGMQTATWGRLLMGAGTAGVWIPSLKYLSLNFRPHIFATLSSIISAVGCLGQTLGTLPLALMVAVTGWRFPFRLAAVLLFCLVAVTWYLLRLPGGSEPTPDQGEDIAPEENRPEIQPVAVHKKETPFWRDPVYWYFVVWVFLYYGVLYSFTGLWGIKYLQDSFQLSRETASVHLLFSTLGTVIGSLFWGVLSDRIVRARKPLLIAGTVFSLFFWLIIYSLKLYPGGFIVSLLYFGIGLCGMVFILVFSCTREYFPLRTAGTAMGTINAFMLGGAAVFQGLTGILLDRASEAVNAPGFRTVFLFYLAVLIAALVFTLFIPETYPGKTRQPVLSGATAGDKMPGRD